MYLKQLDIHGFKTFAEKTQIVFTPGVTCVIGPNGSGKSNISDAILWVLGENNVRSLRGSAAQDVIFAGNERRRPLGMAQVSLTIDNSERILPLDFSEITVTRRLYRSGETECLINSVSCRLKDIYELFLDTGVGRDAYSLVNQGEIDQILSVRAEDRRAIFEEAAGIKKYRVRKREAERKLEHTAQNLLRVNDIVSEIEGQLGPLQRQAAAARRYRDLAARLGVLENAWYGTRLNRLAGERESLARLARELDAERDRLEAELKTAQERERAARGAVQGLERRAEALRQAETGALQRVAAAQAERARAEEREREVRRRLEALAREMEELGARIEDQVRRAGLADREEADLRRQVDVLRGDLLRAQAAAKEAAAAYDAAARELEQRRQLWLARARRQAELEARTQALEGRLQSLEGARKNAAEALEDVEAERGRLEAERESFRKAAAEHAARARDLTAELEGLRDAARGAEQRLAATRSTADAAARAHGSHSARLAALSELGERGEGAAAGAKRLLEAARRGQVPGRWSLLIEGLTVPEGLEKAVEAALGIYGDAVLCDREEHALAAARWLRGQKSGALILPGLPSGAGDLLPHSLGAAVRAPDPESPALAWARVLLGRALVVEKLEDARAATPGSADEASGNEASIPPASTAPSSAQSPIPNPQSPIGESATRNPQSAIELWVTPDGQWLSRAGALSAGVAGAEGSAAAALARRREIERLRDEVPRLEAAAEAARAALREAEAEVRKALGAARERGSEAERVRLEQQAQSREADRRNGDVERLRHRLERQQADAGRLEREQAAAGSELEQLRRERDAAAGEGPGAEDAPEGERALAALQEGLKVHERARREAENAVTEVRVRLAQQEQRLQSASAAARRAADAGASLDRQRGDRLREQRTLTAESEQGKLSFETLVSTVTEAEAAIAAARSELAALAEERTGRAAEADEARALSQGLEQRLRELMERSHRARLELTAVDTERGHLGQQWLDAVLAQEPASPGQEGEEPPPPTVETLLQAWDARGAEMVLAAQRDPEGEIHRLRRQIRSLGAVNPDAVEQHAAAQERYEFLTSQRADLEAAREQLEGAIQEIDAASRETFLRAFQEIAAAFDEMFQKLFGGGTTELRLTEPDNVLETGIDVIVQPPGKKQQNLLLLSGGERALTAAAMLFALLKVRPSPFCVLDEVDAPLDEHNVGRFSRTLREFAARTQFIVVTHNRGTMEESDTLYGVTMEERGVSKVLSCSLDDPVVAQIEREAAVAKN